MDALALVELSSVARGYRVLDWMVKEAPVTVVEANLVEPGKFLILLGGGVAEVQAAFDEALAHAGDTLLDKLLLPGVHERVWQTLAGGEHRGPGWSRLGPGVFAEPRVDCVGVVEGSTVASVMEAADRSAKDAGAYLAALRLSPALGGKAYYVVTGMQHEVEAAVDIGRAVLVSRGRLVDAQVIPNAHDEFLEHLLRPAPFSARRGD
ncbi:MAG: BMC domain-containing protein [Deltaproteobacteria bacterium]|nr:BMC domain-containing protein [Deltaproteobacteria bacterium]